MKKNKVPLVPTANQRYFLFYSIKSFVAYKFASIPLFLFFLVFLFFSLVHSSTSTSTFHLFHHTHLHYFPSFLLSFTHTTHIHTYIHNASLSFLHRYRLCQARCRPLYRHPRPLGKRISSVILAHRTCLPPLNLSFPPTEGRFRCPLHTHAHPDTPLADHLRLHKTNRSGGVEKRCRGLCTIFYQCSPRSCLLPMEATQDGYTTVSRNPQHPTRKEVSIDQETALHKKEKRRFFLRCFLTNAMRPWTFS